jgi:ABC-type antimicrobial peptide transport system permease subunit
MRVGIKEEVPLMRRISTVILGLLILAALGYVIYRFRAPSAAKIKDKKD